VRYTCKGRRPNQWSWWCRDECWSRRSVRRKHCTHDRDHITTSLSRIAFFRASHSTSYSILRALQMFNIIHYILTYHSSISRVIWDVLRTPLKTLYYIYQQTKWWMPLAFHLLITNLLTQMWNLDLLVNLSSTLLIIIFNVLLILLTFVIKLCRYFNRYIRILFVFFRIM